MNFQKRFFILLLIAFALTGCKKNNLFSQILGTATPSQEPELLQIFRDSYPDFEFTSKYVKEKKDWKINIKSEHEEAILYWADGKFLPEEELENKDKYSMILYKYNYGVPLEEPSYTTEQIEQIKNFGSDDNRKNGAGTPMFLYDVIYNGYFRTTIEKHIKTIKFLGFSVKVHERLIEPLVQVEKQILAAAKTNSQVSKYVSSLAKNEGYYWRLIANTNRKSFHSLGIALDIQPKYYGGKEVFWSWAKDTNPDGWMLTPLKNRWMPPQEVIDIFESQGFIWGGKWVIFDNMHFEYHPELINYAKTLN